MLSPAATAPPPVTATAGDLRRLLPTLPFSSPTALPLRIRLKSPTKPRLRRHFAVSGNLSGAGEPDGGEDFVSRVLRQNPSQVEPKYLVGGRLVTLREKLRSNRGHDADYFELRRRLIAEPGASKRPDASKPVYLNDVLREFRGKLYVPEAALKEDLSEEEEFERNLKELPLMSPDDFWKHLEAGKVRLLTSRSRVAGYEENEEEEKWEGVMEFVVDLEEIPGDKSMQKTKWALRLSESEAWAALEEYKGPQYEIAEHTMSYVGKIPEYPHPVASSISSRMMVELGAVAVFVGAAAAVMAGFVASAAFTVTSVLYAATINVLWPVTRPLLKAVVIIVSSLAERFWDFIVDIFGDQGVIATTYKVFTLGGGITASFGALKPMLIILCLMVGVARFTLARKPKNFRKWDIWQGIEFGRSRAQARVDGSTGVTFKDVAGIDEAVEELQELVRYLKNPELFEQMGIKPPHGVLLEGPPGCGKTLVAKAIAGEAGVPFYQMAGSEFVEVLVGVGSARIRDLFKRAKVNKPAVVFIDEIDALATRRQGIFNESKKYQYNAATQERETTLNQLLIELDGFDTGKGVIFLGATNRRDLLDPALLRPGRFDRKIKICPPGAKGRLDILKVHARKVKMSPSVDLSTYAKDLPGWTGAKLAQLIQESALVAVRKGHDSILQSDMDEAVDRLTIGPKRYGSELGHQGQCRRAVTQVGLAMTSHLLRRYEDAKVEFCERISIIPRGKAPCQIVFHHLDDEEYMFERKPQLLHRLQVLLGGRAAEEVIYGRDTSTASVGYLEDATSLARKILTIWNLENPMTIHGEPFPWRKRPQFIGPRLDFEGSLYKHYGFIEPTINFDLDDRVAQRTEELMRETHAKVVSLLRRHAAALAKAVKVLLDNKEMSGEQIDLILDNYPADTPLKLVVEERDPGSLPLFEASGDCDMGLPLFSVQEEPRDVAAA